MSAPADDVKSLFGKALELATPAERAAFLDEACAANPALRRELEGLLQALGQAGNFMNPPTPPSGTSLPPLAERPGMVIGPYKLLQEIGEGGMGTVFLAEQTEPLRRKVALKIIKAGLDSAQVIARFEAERQALALMDHPNIAKVLDAGTTPGEPGSASSGRPYFVMELVKGVSITAFCDENRLTPRQRLELFIPVCQAIQHAHHKGIIHRDIKPSNVMVCLYDGKPVPKVIDFGIAKATDQPLTEKTLFTRHGQIVGTFEYMSPEQATLDALDVDTRSDIYSLGVLLYELLTGTTPLDKERLRQAALLEVLRLIREEEAPRPSSRLSESRGALLAAAVQRHTDADKLLGLVAGELDWIVMKSLEKDRNRRYATANGFVRDVQRYLADETVEACPPSVAYRFRKFARQNKAALLMASVVTLALFASVIVLLISNLLIRQETREKESALEEKSQALVAAKASAEEAKTQEGIAQGNARKTQIQRSMAEKNEKLARRRYYAAQMNLAVQAWETGDTPRVLELLETQRPRFDEEDFRSFEWYALWQLCHQRLRFSLPANTGFTYTVAFSPDSLTVALGSTDGTVKLMDAADGREIRTLRGGARSRAGAVAFTPDGKLLAQGTGPTDDEVTLWNVSTGEKAQLLSGTGSLDTLVFLPDGKILATGTQEGAVKLWDIARGVLKDAWKTHPVLAISFTPDGKLLVTSGDRGQTEKKATLVWDLSDSPPRMVRQIDPGGKTVAFSADGKQFAVGRPGAFTLLDTDTWKEIPVKKGKWGWGRSLAFIPGRDALAVGVETRSVKIVDLKTADAATFPHRAPVRSLAVAADGKAVAAIGDDAVLKVWNLGAAAYPDVIDVGGYVNCLSLSPDGLTLAVGMPKMVRLFDVATGAPKGELTGHSLGVGTLAFFQDGNTLAAGSARWSDPGEFKLWNLHNGKERVPSPKWSAAAHAIALAPDERTLAVGGPQGQLALFDVDTGRRRKLLKAPQLTALAYSPDGKLLVSAEKMGKVTFRDPTTGAERLTFGLKEFSTFTWGLSCSQDGKLLATGNAMGLVHLWELPSGRLRATLRGSTTAVYSVAFFPDGKTLATSSDDGEVRLWDVSTGQERTTFRLGHRLAISADGKVLAAGTNGKVWLLRASATPEALARKKELDPEDPESPVAENEGGDRLWSAGQKQEAQAAFRRAQERLTLLVTHFPDNAAYRRELLRSDLTLEILLTGGGVSTGEISRPSREAFGQLPVHEQLNLIRRFAALGAALRTSPPQDEAEPALRLSRELLRTLSASKLTTPDLRQGTDACYNALIGSLRAKQNFPEAVEVYREWIGLYTRLVAAQPKEPAVRQQLVQIRQALAQLYSARGWVFHHDRKYEEAAKLFRQAIELSEKLAAESEGNPEARHLLEQAWTALGFTLFSGDEGEKALQAHRQGLAVAEKLAHEFPNEVHYQDRPALSHLHLGMVLRKAGQDDEAIGHYRQVIDFFATHPEQKDPHSLRGKALAGLAGALSRRGQMQQAAEIRDTLLKSKPESAAACNNLAWLLATCADAKVRNPTRAVELARKAVELAPKEGSFWNTLGAARYRAGDWKAAIEALHKSMELRSGGDGHDWYFLAMAHWQLGQKGEAHKWYDQAVERMKKNRLHDEELSRFRVEAAELLKVNEKM